MIQPVTQKKVKYLNNRDLLAEIHRSKNSFSSFTKEEFNQYDIILTSLDKVNIRTIAEAKRARAKRLGLLSFLEAKNNGDKKVKLADVTPDYKSISKTDIIIRIMTFDHIPLSPGRKKTTKTLADNHEKVNFPPFQHWKFDDSDELICVGKSHWKGGVKTGKFSKDHGRITENLGRMFIKLSERYAQRSNWRGYTYIDEMRGQAILQLSQIGLQFDESKSENPFAYYTAAVTNSFTRILNIEKKNQNIRDDMLEEAGLSPSMTRQHNHEYADEIARQAEIYKNLRMPKSTEDDIEETEN
jgi:protein-tyrosine-phosphatase